MECLEINKILKSDSQIWIYGYKRLKKYKIPKSK